MGDVYDSSKPDFSVLTLTRAGLSSLRLKKTYCSQLSFSLLAFLFDPLLILPELSGLCLGFRADQIYLAPSLILDPGLVVDPTIPDLDHADWSCHLGRLIQSVLAC